MQSIQSTSQQITGNPAALVAGHREDAPTTAVQQGEIPANLPPDPHEAIDDRDTMLMSAAAWAFLNRGELDIQEVQDPVGLAKSTADYAAEIHPLAKRTHTAAVFRAGPLLR